MIIPLETVFKVYFSAKACSIMIENLPLMLEKLSEAKKPDDVRNYLLPLLGRALAQEKQTNLQVF